jgi:hypothetical protein
MPPNQLSFTSLPHDLHDDTMCTTHRHSSASFEEKLGNPSPTCFTMKQVIESRCVSSHHLHPLISFEAQTNKPPPFGFEAQTKKWLHWFWGTNHQTIDHDFEAQTKKSLQWFWGQTVATGFETKPENPCFSSPPRVRCGLHTVSLDLPIIQPLSTQLVPDHPRSSAPSLILQPRFSSLPAMSHSPPTHNETRKHISPHQITQFGVSSTKIHWIQIQTKESQLLIAQIDQGTNHLVSDSKYLSTGICPVAA